ncbi:hypothetical protein MTP04_16490 [Lysinibacillus sp. PLM2]|nr:hypothetical protein MTP04_16490 [Lysinibacillus sp. PLM2]
MNDMYEKNYPELKKHDGYTSPASSYPLHELKVLQDYIHHVNLQNLGDKLPNYKKQFILIKFFKSKKNQLVEVYSKNKDDVLHSIGKVSVVGRNFVILIILFNRYWIPFSAIQSAKTPFGIPDVPRNHQHVVIDEELRKKLLTNFGATVSKREELKQQFFDQLLESNLRNWVGTKVNLYADKIYKGKIVQIKDGNLHLTHNQIIPLSKITYIKQVRSMSFFERTLYSIFKK